MVAAHVDISITTSAQVVTFIAAFVIPLVTALVTKVNARPVIKQFITALLSAFTGLINAAVSINGEAFFSQEALMLALGTFLLSQAAYLGLYKPHALDAHILPTRGIGCCSTPTTKKEPAMSFSPEAISSKRTAVNSAITIYLIGLVNTIFGWEIKLDDVSVLWIGAAIGFVMGIVYRLSRYATAKWPQLGWVLFGSGQEPAGMKPIK